MTAAEPPVGAVLSPQDGNVASMPGSWAMGLNAQGMKQGIKGEENDRAR